MIPRNRWPRCNTIKASPPEIENLVRQMLPDLLTMGPAKHFLTDYGDEATYTLPWTLFTA